MSEDAALKHLARYLETYRLQQRSHQSHLPMFLSPIHKKRNNLDRQDLEYFLKLLAKKNIDLELKFFIKNWLAHNYRSNHNPIADQITDQEPEYLLSSIYYNLESLKRPEEKQLNENNEPFPKNIKYEQIFDVDRDSMEPILDSFGKNTDFIHGMEMLHHEGGREAAPMRSATASATTEPEFTYKFDNSNLEEKHPFAVKPNDPRYYGEAPFSLGKHSYLIHSFVFYQNSSKKIR